MRPEFAAIVARRLPCACGRPPVFGPRCRPCFTRRPLDEQISDLEGLVLDAEARRDFPEFERYLKAYEAAVLGETRPEPPA